MTDYQVRIESRAIVELISVSAASPEAAAVTAMDKFIAGASKARAENAEVTGITWPDNEPTFA